MSNTIYSDIDNDTGTTEKVYGTSEVAKIIGIAPVTVRKYSQSLENKGYIFIRSKVKGRQKARLYRYRDVESLRYLKEIREESNITVEQATGVTIERLGKGAIQGIGGTDTANKGDSKQYSNQYDELIEMMNKQGNRIDKQSDYLIKQNELIGNLINRIDEQDKYISNKLAAPTEQKEIEAPKEIQTLKNIKIPKLDETPKEIEAAPKEEKKKGFFSKLVDIFIVDTRDDK